MLVTGEAVQPEAELQLSAMECHGERMNVKRRRLTKSEPNAKRENFVEGALDGEEALYTGADRKRSAILGYTRRRNFPI